MYFDRLLNQIVDETLKKTAASYSVKSTVDSELEKIASGLEKIASVQNEDLVKIADSVKGIAKYAGDAILNLQSENCSLKEKLATLEKAASVREVVESMLEKGAISDSEAESKTRELMSKSAEDIMIHKKAVEMLKTASSLTGSSIGTLEESSTGTSRVNPMEAVVMG